MAQFENIDPDQQAALSGELGLLLVHLKSRIGPAELLPRAEFETGRAYELVTQWFGPNLPYSAVRDIAEQLAFSSEVSLARECTLRIDQLFAWMDQNLDQLLPWFDDVTLDDESVQGP
jgi:hypothetical protein